MGYATGMAKYQEIVERVRRRADLHTVEGAREATEHVVSAIAYRLDDADRKHLADALPAALREATVPTPPNSPTGEHGVVHDIAHRGDYTYEQARYLAQAVVGVMHELDPSVVRTVVSAVDGLAGLVPTSAADPGWRSDTATDRPNRLTRDEIAAALRDLPEWSGDVRRLRRTISLPADRATPLLNAITSAERQANHPAHIERHGDELTVTVWTRSLNAVTDLDTDLAGRINQAIDAIGSGG